MSLESVLGRVKERLAGRGYGNEASVSQGVVLPILDSLGWDTTDTDAVAPEFANERGRVDYALCSAGRRPAVFIEVKGVGRSLDGDRQLFEYAFHTGVPLCVLTDGREWAFYLPGGQGSYDDRRVYLLQIDERAPQEAVARLTRYLARDRVLDGRAHEDAQRDYRDIAARREAVRVLPRAWAELVNQGESQLIDLVSEQAEQLCGVCPPANEVLAYLRSIDIGALRTSTSSKAQATKVHTQKSVEVPTDAGPADPSSDTLDKTINAKITYKWFGETLSAPTAVGAMIDVLKRLAARHPERLEELARRVRSRKRSLVARTPNEINPSRPDLAKAVDLADGWLVGTHTSNREKMKIIRAACDVMDVRYGIDLTIELPNGWSHHSIRCPEPAESRPKHRRP